MKVTEVRASTALSPSRLPGLDWALNPYRGCGHGCVYCYSPDVLRLKETEPWGSFVEVRKNLPVLLARERKACSGVVGLGTVTDPYQPAEERTRLTRYCLEQLAKAKCSVCVQTKSDLVTRDIDIISGMGNAEVGITITSVNEELARQLEPGAPEPARRVAALKELSGAGIRTWVFLGPVIPGINDSCEQMAAVIDAAEKAGCGRVLFDKLRLKPMVRERMRKMLGFARSERIFRLVGDREWEERVTVDIEVLCDDAKMKSEKAF